MSTAVVEPLAPPPHGTGRPRFSVLRETLRGWASLRATPYGVSPVLTLALVLFVERLDDGTFTLASPQFVRRGINIGSLIEVLALIGLVTVFANLIIGYAAERTRRVPYLSIGTVVSGIACAFTGFGRTFSGLAYPRALDTGIGTNAANVPIFALASDYYPTAFRVRAFSLISAAGAIAELAALPIGAVLVSDLGLTTTFIAIGAALVVVGIFTQLSLREPARGEMERRETGLADQAKVEDEPLSFGETWRTVFAIRTVRRLFLGDIVYGFADVARYYTVLLLADVYHLSVFGFAYFTLPQIAVGLIARFFAGAAVDRLLGGHARRAFSLYAVFSAGIAVGFTCIGAEPPLALLEIPLCLLAAGGALIGPAVSALYSEVLPARIRTLGIQVTGLAVTPGLVIGTTLLNSLFVKHGYSVIYFVAGPFALVAAIIYLTAGQFFEIDRANALAQAAASRRWAEAKAAGATQLLACSAIRVGYEGVPVLFGVDLTIDEGEIVALLGTNGAGKSTLLRAISGTQEASGGAVLFDGRDITHMPPHEIARRGVVQMPGGQGIFPDLSVRENLLLGGWTRRDGGVRDDTGELLEMFPALRRRLDEPAGVLSGGEQQMLALALAFLMRPRLLLIDELSLGLSPAAVGELVQAVRQIHARGVAVVVVEQSVALALQLADRAVFMEKGQVRFDGPTGDLLQRPDIVRAVYLTGADGGRAVPEQRRRALAAPGIDLEVAGLTKSYGGVRALDDVSFLLGRGEVLGVIGPNGSGKTTLFDVVSGLVPADAGEIRLAGDDVTALSADARARLGLLRRFQDARQFPTLSVLETILLALENSLAVRNPLLTSISTPRARRAERRARGRAEAVIELLELGSYRDTPTGELSTGLRRIVDLGCVIAARPKVLLLDEPSTGIAQAEAEGLAPMLRRVQQENCCSILIIEHHMQLLRSVADRFIALAGGRLIAEGAPDDVLADAAVAEAYLGASTPPRRSALTRPSRTAGEPS